MEVAVYRIKFPAVNLQVAAQRLNREEQQECVAPFTIFSKQLAADTSRSTNIAFKKAMHIPLSGSPVVCYDIPAITLR